MAQANAREEEALLVQQELLFLTWEGTRCPVHTVYP